MTIRTILVDDEPLAIQGLEIRLQRFDDVGWATSAPESVAMLVYTG